jgi:hypothetical protein
MTLDHLNRLNFVTTAEFLLVILKGFAKTDFGVQGQKGHLF